MTDPGDAMPAEGPTASPLATAAPANALPEASDDFAADDRAARRAALHDLAAMIGVEVFY